MRVTSAALLKHDAAPLPGRALALRTAFGTSTLGRVLIAHTARGLASIRIGSDQQSLMSELEASLPGAEILRPNPDSARILAAVIAYLDHPMQGLHLPLDVIGTPFQRRVWRALADIAPGRTATYTEIATLIGRPSAARAVAAACAANPLAVVIPCHRVIRTDGSLSGYRWGPDLKRRLLEREAKSV